MIAVTADGLTMAFLRPGRFTEPIRPGRFTEPEPARIGVPTIFQCDYNYVFIVEINMLLRFRVHCAGVTCLCATSTKYCTGP